jgi:hypothetical protein
MENRPAIQDALWEQLGLRLESAGVPWRIMGSTMWKSHQRISGRYGWQKPRDHGSEKPCNLCAAFSSKVRVAEQSLQIPREPINASSKVPVPFLKAKTAL